MASPNETETKTREAENLADAILRAAGSGLRHYTMASGRGFILATAQSFIADVRVDLVAAMDPDTLEAIADEIDCHEHSARAGSLRVLAKQQRTALAKVGA